MTTVRQISPQPARGPQTMFHRVFRADPGSVRLILTEIGRRFSSIVDTGTAGRLELVLAEVLNNIGEHGSSAGAHHPLHEIWLQGPDSRPRPLPGATVATARVPLVHLCLTRHTTGIACAVTDDGQQLPAECLIRREPGGYDGPAEALPEGGFGWLLIHDLTQALCYFREGNRNFLAFCIPWEDTANQR